ncbi:MULTISPECIES: ABC transporter permease [unclassified Nocardioides]|uniref:branched-chain amino acid ABC transporter permease n=1 Tax=unclassified Nocardioides TaxID=2615069 RepID=UPI00116B5D3D|nr:MULTISPECIES: ABC transporter permease [unclassified Nocardioides]TQK70151.1 branched-chain amino acid transport system permease protein [Nocardioides sp. SLBN-35]WGY00620.1 ABC transporter permease [Nocardioides sp. QY071]
MGSLFAFTLLGLFTGAAYAIMASGLVLTYTTTRVFNIAHGAFGMFLSFVFWDFTQRQGMPTVLSLILVLGVVAPAIGWFIQRFVTRGLGEGPVSVALVVTVGLLVGLIGLAQQIWPPEPRVLLPFWSGTGWQLGDTFVTAHQLVTLVCAVAVAFGLYLLLSRTRIGTAMRASVDNPELLKLFGGKPDRVAALSWSIGISLAALGGILLTPVVLLDYYALTLLVINAYAAAMLGRLKSLPMTFAGAMILGVLESWAVGYLPTDGFLASFRPVIPALFLFAIVVLMPQAQLRIGQVKGIVTAAVPSMRLSIGSGTGLLLVTLLLVNVVAPNQVLLIGVAATYAMVMLSLVLLTGYGGHVSLAQFTFAGVGALAYAKLDEPNLLGLLLSALIAAAVGALVALPVLRLTGLYLALSTMAFAVLMDKVVFNAEFAFKFNGTLAAERLSILGLRIGSDTAYVWFMVLAFVLLALGLLVLRRGALGRLLIAMRDSPSACGTLGLDMRWFRVGLFALSAGIAGFAGGLFAGLRGTVGAADFLYFQSLLVLLLAVVFGATSVTGALLGGVALMLLPELQAASPGMAGLLFAVIGFGAVLLGRDPNGLANHLFRIGRWLRARLAPALGGRLEGRLQGLLPRGGSPGGTDGAVDVPLVDMAVDVAVDVEKVG